MKQPVKTQATKHPSRSQLLKLLKSSVKNEDKLRASLSGYLHDEICPLVTLVRQYLEIRELKEKLPDKYSEEKMHLTNASLRLRELFSSTYPGAIKYVGLFSMLRTKCFSYESRTIRFSDNCSYGEHEPFILSKKLNIYFLLSSILDLVIDRLSFSIMEVRAYEDNYMLVVDMIPHLTVNVDSEWTAISGRPEEFTDADIRLAALRGEMNFISQPRKLLRIYLPITSRRAHQK